MPYPYVRFPGTPTDYISTPDTNLLDANTAHMRQGQPWGGVGLTVVQEGIQPDGYGQIACTQIAAGNGYTPNSVALQGQQPFTIPAGDFRVVFSLDELSAPGDRTFRGLVREPILTTSTTVVSPSTSPQTVILSGTTTGETYEQIWLETRGWEGGETFKISKVMLAAGSSVSEFVPSMSIPGTVYEQKEPSDMPVSYAYGTGLQIGNGWAGYGKHYRRFDGSDEGALLVASFEARDVGGAL